MARKLKTYQTSLGFFDLAIAAPSMKAALEAWGADSNLFHQGAAKQSDDPDVVAATLSKPGIILKRPVGTHGPFREHADVPKRLSGDKSPHKRAKARTKKNHVSRPTDDKAAKKAALAFEREQRQRERERQKEDAASAKERKRQQRATAKAQAAMEKAEQAHDKRARTIETERAALDKRAKTEDTRWEKQRQKLQTALRRARD